MVMAFQIIVRITLLLLHCHAEETAKHRQYQPRNQFWEHVQQERKGLQDDAGERYHDMKKCLQEKKLLHEDDDGMYTSPTIVDSLTDTKNRTILVELANAISASHVRYIQDLASCTRQYFPDTRLEHRNFEDSGGGNDVTFINILLQLFLPDVYDTVVRVTEMAYNETGWGTQLGLRPPSKCGLRTAEHLDYGQFKGLGSHTDTGSIYTTLFALSDSKQYKGGEYYIVPRNEPNKRQYYFKPKQYSAIIFLSETRHGVTDIESGSREMYTNEFWSYDDPPWSAARRPENHDMEQFSKRCNEELDVPSDVYYHSRDDIDRLWPSSYEDDDLTTRDDEDDFNHVYESEL